MKPKYAWWRWIGRLPFFHYEEYQSKQWHGLPRTGKPGLGEKFEITVTLFRDLVTPFTGHHYSVPLYTDVYTVASQQTSDKAMLVPDAAPDNIFSDHYVYVKHEGRVLACK